MNAGTFKAGQTPWNNGPDPKRWRELGEAAAFYRAVRDTGNIACRAIENPIMHRHAIKATGRAKAQFVQPWWFGDPFFKATGLELVNLPPLAPTNRLTPPKPGTADHKAWSAVHREPPGPDRARKRSETYPGFAAAIARQFGDAAQERISA